MCGHLWREMFVSKKKFYDLLFVFSSVFETPLFRLTNRRIASKLQTWWKKEDAGRGTLTNWYVFCTIESKILRPHLNFDTVSYIKRNDSKVSNIKDESFECLILKSSNAIGLVGFLFGLTLTLCFCCFVDAEVEKKKYWYGPKQKIWNIQCEKVSSSVLRFFYNLFQNIFK